MTHQPKVTTEDEEEIDNCSLILKSSKILGGRIHELAREYMKGSPNVCFALIVNVCYNQIPNDPNCPCYGSSVFVGQLNTFVQQWEVKSPSDLVAIVNDTNVSLIYAASTGPSGSESENPNYDRKG